MIEHYSDHAANERTFLAWVRTAIAIMAFGFLVEKFDLFLRLAGTSRLGDAVVSASGAALPHRHLCFEPVHFADQRLARVLQLVAGGLVGLGGREDRRQPVQGLR
jgi:uncharacterized membrane protein YidH (DUF202 family)